MGARSFCQAAWKIYIISAEARIGDFRANRRGIADKPGAGRREAQSALGICAECAEALINVMVLITTEQDLSHSAK